MTDDPDNKLTLDAKLSKHRRAADARMEEFMRDVYANAASDMDDKAFLRAVVLRQLIAVQQEMSDLQVELLDELEKPRNATLVRGRCYR
jgi:hypothetical protein